MNSLRASEQKWAGRRRYGSHSHPSSGCLSMVRFTPKSRHQGSPTIRVGCGGAGRVHRTSGCSTVSSILGLTRAYPVTAILLRCGHARAPAVSAAIDGIQGIGADSPVRVQRIPRQGCLVRGRHALARPQPVLEAAVATAPGPPSPRSPPAGREGRWVSRAPAPRSAGLLDPGGRPGSSHLLAVLPSPEPVPVGGSVKRNELDIRTAPIPMMIPCAVSSRQ
jgi:hypothetical protein